MARTKGKGGGSTKSGKGTPSRTIFRSKAGKKVQVNYTYINAFCFTMTLLPTANNRQKTYIPPLKQERKILKSPPRRQIITSENSLDPLLNVGPGANRLRSNKTQEVAGHTLRGVTNKTIQFSIFLAHSATSIHIFLYRIGRLTTNLCQGEAKERLKKEGIHS